MGEKITTDVNAGEAFDRNAIPDKDGAPVGLLGVKTPFGIKQSDDIHDRLGIKSAQPVVEELEPPFVLMGAMPKVDGRPRFPSRTDSFEAGIVAGTAQLRYKH